MKLFLSILLLASFHFSVTAQSNHEPTVNTGAPTYQYAYVQVRNREFSKNLKVYIDLGDRPAQLSESKAFSDSLSHTQSYTAVLNFLSAHGYDLVSSQALQTSYRGTGGSSGLLFILKRNEAAEK